MAQNYKNHLRFYPLHHFVLTPLSLAYLGLVIASDDFQNATGLDALRELLLPILIFFLLLIARIYALKNQDRLIRLEMRQRYFELTGQSFFEKEKKLGMKKIIALRFASNEELATLVEKALAENLSPKDIKQSIQNWQADNMRV